MKKKLLKIISGSIVLFFVSALIIGCSPFKELKKASKNLSSYAINAELNEEEMSISASQLVKYINKTNVVLNSVCFNLYARAFREGASVKPYTSLNEGKCFPNGKSYGDMEILSVRENEKQANYVLVGEDENALKIDLSKELEPQESVVIQIDFTVYLAECTHRLGYLNYSVNLGNWYPVLAIYEKGEFVIDPYYSTGDPFYSDVANYNVELIYDKEYNLSSSGITKKQEDLGGKIKQQIQATAVRDFAINLTKSVGRMSKKVDDVEIVYNGYSGDTNLENSLNVAIKAFKFFNLKFGKYPYQKLEITKTPFVHGGMEYPGLVFIADTIIQDFDIAKVIVHEIAHQWWYAVVGNNQIKEAWLDESLAEYSTVLFFEAHQEFDVTYEELISEAFANYVLYADIVDSINKQLNTSMLLNVYEYAGDYEYSYMIYVRGVLMFDSLRQIVGKDKLFNALRLYYKKFKFKIAKTDDLISQINKVAGKNSDVLLDSWLKGHAVVGTI